MLAVIDYGAGNLRSVLHALNALGADNIRVVRTAHEMRGAKKIILPGVGAFGAGMNAIRQQNLEPPIKDALLSGVPYLGICLGMQFLFETSDEMGEHRGFGIIKGRVTRFSNTLGLKVPHMGWNQLSIKHSSPLLAGISEGNYAYFVHSYYCIPNSSEDMLITSEYGMEFCAGIQHEHIFGVQFHPEKSQQTGLRLLSNFLEYST